MQSKKNPKSDLTKNSSLYFVIGLVLALFISWGVIENKTYEKKLMDVGVLDINQEGEQETPIIDVKKIPPPPPPAPEVIEIIENDKEREETIIQPSEITKEDIVKDVEVEEDFDDVDVPFAIIEDAPIYPGCENVAKDKLRDCFQEKMNKHIRKNFRYPEIAQEMGIQGRVHITFVIAKDGSITNIRMRGPDRNLEKEAKRIISKLPRMIPGKQRGRAVRVPYSIPITFRLQ